MQNTVENISKNTPQNTRPNAHQKAAKFITFEGVDGAGKSTHIPFIQDCIHKLGYQVYCTREPGGTELGEKLRTLLLYETMHLETECLLMFAARREHVAQIIEPQLAQGVCVLSDRFTDASFAYQGGGRGLALQKLDALEQWVHPHLQPDLTFLFDVPIDVAKARLQATRELDKFEKEQSVFFENVRTEYLRRARLFPQRFVIVDSTQSISDIQKQCELIIRRLFQIESL